MTPMSTNLRTAREETIDALCRQFADEAISLSELERRLDRAREARNRDELDALLRDLPRPPKAVPTPQDATRVATPAPSKPKRETPAVRPAKHLAFAVMGGTRRAGKWRVPESMLAMSLMGGVVLDFRDAIFEEGSVDVACFTFWGGIEVIVPPDVNVETHGMALLGGFEQLSDVAPKPRPDAPTVRVNGLSIMGGVEVKVREKGAKLEKPDW